MADKPKSPEYNRANYMVQDVAPSLTEYVGVLVVKESGAYRSVYNQLHPEQDSSEINGEKLNPANSEQFFTYLCARFEENSLYINPKTGSPRCEVQALFNSSYRNLEESRDGAFFESELRDSMTFASLFIAGTAWDTSRYLNKNGFKTSVTEILRRDDFHRLANQLARTDFNFYRQSSVTFLTLVGTEVAERIGALVGEPINDFSKLIIIDSEGKVALKGEYRQALAAAIPRRNALMQSDPDAMYQSKDGIFSSAGCPVIHVRDNNNSIAVLSKYLAGQYENYMRIVHMREIALRDLGLLSDNSEGGDQVYLLGE